jgi:hypothetical protein
MGTQLPGAKHWKTESPACRQCGGISHCRRDCPQQCSEVDRRKRTGTWETSRGWHKEEGGAVIAPTSSFCTQTVNRSDDSLNAKGWVEGRPCLVIIYIGASITDISIRLPKRELAQLYVLQMVSGRPTPEGRQSPLCIWVLLRLLTNSSWGWMSWMSTTCP